MKIIQHSFFLFLSLCGFLTHAQQISTVASNNPTQLVQDALSNDCIQISNVRSTNNGGINGISSYGSFNRGASTFPFQSGFLITTGDVTKAGNGFIGATLSDGTNTWLGDSDLETALGTTNTVNATVIEFNLISVTNQISFNYIMASEEYQLDFPCNVSDGFALLIRPTGSTGPYQNLAIVPGTATAVGINTVRPAIAGQCGAQNESFFAGTNLGQTNYQGRTVPLTATANVIPNISYSLKMVVADQFDTLADTAIFIENNSLTSSVDLGPDQVPCESTTLNADVANPLATYRWFFNGNLLPAQNSSSLFVNTSGNYRVEIAVPSGANTCVIIDDVNVLINPNQLDFAADDLSLCDLENRDGIETFNFSATRAAILASLGTGNYSVNFYTSNANANAQLNALGDSYTNQVNNQVIHIRVNNLDSSCFAINTFVLRVILPPALNDVTYSQCDSDSDGFDEIEFPSIDALLNPSGTGANITYHLTRAQALSGESPLPTNYRNITSPQIIFARAIDPVTGCVSTSAVTVNITRLLNFNATNPFIDACDRDYDGFANFNLRSVEGQFTTGLSNFTVSYHITQQDAQIGANPISNPTSFRNTVREVQDVFIRVLTPNGCPSVGRIRLWTNYLLDATTLSDIRVCDDTSNNGSEPIDLIRITDRILNGLPAIQVYFYASQADQLADVNRLDVNLPYFNSINPQTIWVRLENSGCFEIADFSFIVVPNFSLQPIPDQTFCDNNSDRITTISLNFFDNVARGSLGTDHSVQYFLTQQDAEAFINPITTYTNTTPTFTLWAQVTNPEGCSDIQPITINVLAGPEITDPSPIIICDNDDDGFFIVNLRLQENQIITAPNHTITYHTTLEDANSASNPISTPTAFNAFTQNIFVRVVDDSNGCFDIANQSIIVNTLPIFPAITTYVVCETNDDGFEPFFLGTKDAEILNGQTGKVVSYYETAQDANNRVNAINGFTPYINLTSPQTIHVRVENITDISCFGISNFQIEVGDPPVYNNPSDIVKSCDDDDDGIIVFDLQPTIDEITAGVSNSLNVTFYTNNADAEARINQLPTAYRNTTNPQTIVARIENEIGCFKLELITLSVIPIPQVNVIEPLTRCDEDFDGLNVFNLSSLERRIVGERPFNSLITWHTTINDANLGANNIQNISAFTNTQNPQTVYLRIYNTISDCYALSLVELIVNIPPPFSVVTEFKICENPLNEVDLNQANSLFIDPLPPTVNITYYSNLTDAEDETNELPVPFNYTSSRTSIFARLVDTATGCNTTTSFTLVVEESPQLPALGSYDLTFCDDDYDGFLRVDLTQNSGLISSLEDSTTHTVSYFRNENDAIANANEITNPILTTDGTIFYVRLTENSLGCVSLGSFNVTINPLPDPPVNDFYVICEEFVDITAGTGEPGETYLWSTGETTPTIRVNTPGTYFVTLVSASGCTSFRAQILVQQSSTAEIDFIASTNFDTPNTITVVVNGIGDYLYILDNGTPQRSNVFTNVRPGFHDVQVIDINGCGATPPQRVLIIDYPRFFTPNADGYNDFWQVDDITTFDNATFYIFDRYGKLLKTFGKESLGWDGTYLGNPMPSSDYWFSLEIKDSRGDINVKGHFSLKR